MIIVKVMAGLGNQMFQYAVGRRLAVKRNTQLLLDITSYENMADIDTPRQYELDCYSIQAEIASKKLLAKVQPPETKRTLPEKVLRRLGIGKYWQIGEGDGSFNKGILSAPNNTYLVGWWQNEKYFADIRSQLIKEFEPKNKPNKTNAKILKEIQHCNAVAIHVRRGDYVSNKHANVHHGLTPLEYYTRAIAHVRKEVKTPRFFVFSDDLEWCKKSFNLGKDAVFVDGNGGKMAYEDLRLMKHCKHNIIANSSFSWWGAWLNQNPDKIVIAPKIWFQDKQANSSTGIVPKEWKRI